MGRGEDRVVPAEERSAEDRGSLRWAVSTRHPIGTEVAERVRSGGTGVTVAELAAIRDDWEQAGRPAPERHVHRTAVRFEDGSVVTGVTFIGDDPYGRAVQPSFGLYLDDRWSPPWPHAHVDWQDFGIPADIEALRRSLLDLIERAKQDGGVEIGCLGGHGRTGTALACLAVLTGTPPSAGVEWVRTNYCDRAVETKEQEALVQSFST